MKTTGIISLVFVCVVFLSSCYYDVNEDLNPIGSIDSLSCDTIAVSYSADVLPVIEFNCYTCHSTAANLGGITLEGYNSIKVYADNGRLEGAINHESGFSWMPQDAAMLDDCDLALINGWINQGALNN